jgi:hypothetical protein
MRLVSFPHHTQDTRHSFSPRFLGQSSDEQNPRHH